MTNKLTITGIRFILRRLSDSWVTLLFLVLGIALATRLYDLSSFPYFPTAPPWLGAGPPYSGLYIDEANYAQIANIIPSFISTYQPPLQILAVKLSMLLVGNNVLGSRLPSAIASSLTAALVFLAGKELFDSKGAALVSGLYYSVMIPAVIYGRMLLLENFVGLFLAATIFFVAKFENNNDYKWMYLAALASALASLSKINGIIVPVFFSFWAIRQVRRKGMLGPIALAWVPSMIGVLALGVLAGSVQSLTTQWLVGTVGKELSFQYLAIQSMPSGYELVSGGLVKPEFWYLYAYAGLAILLLFRSRQGRILAEVLVVFLIVSLSVWGFSSYYLTMVFPVLALAAGGGTKFMANGGPILALTFSGGLYVPLVATYVASSTLSVVAINLPIFVLKIILLAFPLLVFPVANLVSMNLLGRPLPLMKVLLCSYFGLLLLATPVLYPQYFLGYAT